jgi:hypothetical protein
MAQMLAPAAVLIVWSLIMLLWVVQTRFGAFAKHNIDLSKSKPGGRGQDLQGVLPDEVMWKSHNYSHLMEQPTIFYPTVVILALMGNSLLDVLFAWAYVAIRIVHSVWQAQVNTIPTRVKLFAASTLCLVVLAIRALYVTLMSL